MLAAVHLCSPAHSRLVATFSPTEQLTRLTKRGWRLPKPPPSIAFGGVEQLTNPRSRARDTGVPSVRPRAIRTTITAIAGREMGLSIPEAVTDRETISVSRVSE